MRNSNIRIYAGDAREIVEALPDASLGRVFILFPDPWPKTRHHKRRFLQTEMLDELARVMKPGAELRFASDDPGYVEWTLERLMRASRIRLDGSRVPRLAKRPAGLAADPLRGQGASRQAGISELQPPLSRGRKRKLELRGRQDGARQGRTIPQPVQDNRQVKRPRVPAHRAEEQPTSENDHHADGAVLDVQRRPSHGGGRRSPR